MLVNSLKALSVSAAFILVFPSVALSHTEHYYPATMCKAVDNAGRVSDAFRFVGAAAINFSQNVDRVLTCPIPLRALNNDPILVRVRAFDSSASRSISASICSTADTDITPPSNCGDTVFSGNPSTGLTVLTPTLTGNVPLRWLNLRISVPRAGNNTRSGVLGYRVCRNGC